MPHSAVLRVQHLRRQLGCVRLACSAVLDDHHPYLLLTHHAADSAVPSRGSLAGGAMAYSGHHLASTAYLAAFACWCPVPSLAGQWREEAFGGEEVTLSAVINVVSAMLIRWCIDEGR